MKLRARTYGSAISIFVLAGSAIACSSGELHSSQKDEPSPDGTGTLKAEIHTINENQDRQGPGSRQDSVSDTDGYGSQKSKKPQRPDQSITSDDTTALPPNNLAGAYLVKPKPAGCFWEKKSISSALLSLCGITFAAKRAPKFDKTDGDKDLKLAATEIANEPIPVIQDNKVTGLIVNAMDPDHAVATAQENFIASKLFLDAESRELDAEAQMTFKLSPGKYVVYTRSELISDSEKPNALSMALELRKVVFSNTLPERNVVSLGELLDSLIGNLLLQTGLLIAAPATGLSLTHDGVLETGLINATSLVKSNVEADLESNKVDFNLLFPATK
jgi:hypothetical protein